MLLYREVNHIKNDLSSIREDITKSMHNETSECVKNIKNINSENLDQMRKISFINQQVVRKKINHFSEDSDNENTHENKFNYLSENISDDDFFDKFAKNQNVDDNKNNDVIIGAGKIKNNSVIHEEGYYMSETTKNTSKNTSKHASKIDNVNSDTYDDDNYIEENNVEDDNINVTKCEQPKITCQQNTKSDNMYIHNDSESVSLCSDGTKNNKSSQEDNKYMFVLCDDDTINESTDNEKNIMLDADNENDADDEDDVDSEDDADDVDSEDDADDVDSEDDADDVDSEDDADDVDSEDDAEDEDSKDDAEDEDSKDDAEDEDSKDDAEDEDDKDDAEDEDSKDDAKDENDKDDAEDANSEDDEEDVNNKDNKDDENNTTYNAIDVVNDEHENDANNVINVNDVNKEDIISEHTSEVGAEIIHIDNVQITQNYVTEKKIKELLNNIKHEPENYDQMCDNITFGSSSQLKTNNSVCDASRDVSDIENITYESLNLIDVYSMKSLKNIASHFELNKSKKVGTKWKSCTKKELYNIIKIYLSENNN